jgi:dipeptidyl aminopeptidase/acylaminoacyl peptidase
MITLPNPRRRGVLPPVAPPGSLQPHDPRAPGLPPRSVPAPHALAPFLAAALLVPQSVAAQDAPFHAPTPVRQSAFTHEAPPPREPFTVRTAARPTRWLGQEVQAVRWSADGRSVYFRWHHDPRPDQDPALDPWYRVDRAGRTVAQVPAADVHTIPGADLTWSHDGRRAAWSRDGAVYVWDSRAAAAQQPRAVFAADRPARDVRITGDGAAVHFMVGVDLYAYDVAAGALRQLTRRHELPRAPRPLARLLEAEQRRLFEQYWIDEADDAARAAARRRLDPHTPQPIPVEAGATISDVQLSPDGRWITFRATTPARDREPVQYADYASASGITAIHTARPKIGEPRDEQRFGIVAVEPSVHPDSVQVRWVSVPEAGERATLVHGPFWSVEGDVAVIQAMSLDHKDLWISRLDPASGAAELLAHEHDPAWLGGPPVLAGSLRPALLEWLPGGRFVFASERTGWSHLYLRERDGTVRPLTTGEWEVRGATLSRDRTRWILEASREHPADDHLYALPAAGGELVRLTAREGRHSAWISPDGARLAVVHSDNVSLPDLYLRDATPRAAETRVTVSGTDRFHAYPLTRPAIVSFAHPDGGLVWAALFRPARQNAERAAVVHVHGGGYRQFAHRGWSVYGYNAHLGFIHYLLEQGYTVLDFDYRGSAGFGRDYRTDIYRSMGQKDVDGGVAGVEYLVREHGIDPARVGIYGLSYGGFFTQMSLFRYPGVFAAGVSDDGVTDWFHYSDGWTSRILNLPHEDAEAFRVSSPIYYAEGLADPLLISHGMIDDNVHFQDAVRLIQRLIELEKAFDVMVYPIERHNFRTESSRYDYYRRVAAFFERHVLGRR